MKSAKRHMYLTLAGTKHTFDELSTALIEIEAILNSRPIAELSTDPNGIEALTPGHLSSLAPATLFHSLRRDQFTRKMASHYCCQTIVLASMDYLNEMIQRKKWFKVTSNLKPGTLVLIHEENLAQLHWLMGRTVATIPGEDRKVRVANIKIVQGVIRQPIHKLVVLIENF